MTSWSLYWITRLDSIHWTLIGGATICVLIAVVNGFMAADEFDFKEAKPYWIRTRKFAVLALLCSFVNTLIPSTNEMAAIIVLPKIANSATVKELGDATVELAKQWLESLKPKKEGTK